MSEYCRTIQIKRGSSLTFQSENLVLCSGELAWEKDTNKIKIGDGTTEWNDLPYLNNDFEVNDVLIFKGTLGTGGTTTSLPSIYQAGWTFKVTTAGTYAGKICEFGDLIISIVDRPEGDGNDNDWIVVQANIDGAVTSLGGTPNRLSKFSSGLVVEDSIVSESGGIVNVGGILNINDISVSVSGHSHVVNDITDFSVGVNGLLPVKDVVAGNNINVSSLDGEFTISATGLQPSGDYSVVGHSHVVNDITDFSVGVSGLLPTIIDGGGI